MDTTKNTTKLAEWKSGYEAKVAVKLAETTIAIAKQTLEIKADAAARRAAWAAGFADREAARVARRAAY